MHLSHRRLAPAVAVDHLLGLLAERAEIDMRLGGEVEERVGEYLRIGENKKVNVSPGFETAKYYLMEGKEYARKSKYAAPQN